MCIDFFQILVRVGSGVDYIVHVRKREAASVQVIGVTTLWLFRECGEMLTENGDKYRNVNSLGLNEIARELFFAESYQSSLEVNASS